MKKLICLILSCVVVFISSVPVQAMDETIIELSEMTESDCLRFAENRGLVLPDEDFEYWGDFIKHTFEMLDENPYVRFAYGWSKAQELSQQLQIIYWEYYGIAVLNPMQRQSYTSGGLQDSVIYGAWEDSYSQYNCYAYAIGYDDWINPGEIHDPDTGYVRRPISGTAEDTKQDLKTIGYQCVVYSTNIPSSTVLNGLSTTICLRLAYYGYSGTVRDYHFMRYENGSWYHKPGGTQPLRYLYTPTNTRNWLNECVVDGYYYSPDIEYTGDIYFITYKENHVLEYEFCGTVGLNYKHTATCEDCNETNVSDCTFGVGNKCIYCGIIKRNISVNSTVVTPMVN